MTPFHIVRGVAAPLLVDDVNTDQIAPVQFTRTLTPDYETVLFGRWRAKAAEDGAEPFVLDQPRFRHPPILVAGANFGCGSAREVAVWALAAHGVRCIVARGFGDVFRESLLKNGMLPVRLAPEDQAPFERMIVQCDGRECIEVDLERQSITGPGDAVFRFDIGETEKAALLAGLDDVAMTLTRQSTIVAWEVRTRGSHPWLQEPSSTA